jgi:hypothetical protein
MSIGMQTVNARLMRFQMRMRTLVGITLEVIHVTLWQITHLHFVHVLRFYRRLSLKVINLVEEFQDSIALRIWHGCCWMILARFTVRSRSAKADQNNLKNMQFGQKRSIFKL